MKSVFKVLPFSVLFVLSAARGGTWYVDDSVGSSGDGRSWVTALKTIQEGIDAASDGEAVIVAQGTYVENIRFNGKNIVLSTAGPFTPAEVGSTVIDANGANPVVTFSGTETEACVLSGFTIRNGQAVGDGGGICGGHYPDYTHATIQNNAIAGNSASLYGGGLFGCSGTIQNNTITGNSAQVGGGGLYACNGMVRNCIIWGNRAPSSPQLGGWSNFPSFSCIEGWSGEGQRNIASEPRFVNPKARDYHLQEDSPCVDGGAGGYWFIWPQRDLDGNCRLAGLAVDMGCYEYGSSADTDGDLMSDADESVAGTDPIRDDSDGDALRDGLEVLRKSNPLQLTLPSTLNVPSEFATIQLSLSVCIAGDEIILAPGTYHENLHFCGPDVVLRSSDPGDPSVVSSTIVDGGRAGPVVSFMGGESQACVLSGFTIRNGDSDCGGGINGDGTLATIRNNTITDNSARESGGGLYECNGTIQNNTIAGNSTGWLGSGGGLAYCDGMIQNNTITLNSSEVNGGGLAYCSGTIQDNIISGNSADNGGGLYECNRRIQNNMITGNSALGGGGGLCWCFGRIWNNVVSGNSALGGGGLYYCGGMTTTMQNNTIAGNSAQSYGGGLYDCDGPIRNCVIWGNTAPTGSQLHESSIPTYSCIEGTTEDPQKKNISGDPCFAGHDAGDFRLLPLSPCIDAGSNDGELPETDIAGMHRVMYGGKTRTVDMGAYEFYVNRLVPLPGTDAALFVWSSVAEKTYSILYTDDMLNWHTAIESFPSAGNQTTWWTDDGSLTSVPPLLAPRRFYRLLENP